MVSPGIATTETGSRWVLAIEMVLERGKGKLMVRMRSRGERVKTVHCIATWSSGCEKFDPARPYKMVQIDGYDYTAMDIVS